MPRREPKGASAWQRGRQAATKRPCGSKPKPSPCWAASPPVPEVPGITVQVWTPRERRDGTATAPRPAPALACASAGRKMGPWAALCRDPYGHRSRPGACPRGAAAAVHSSRCEAGRQVAVWRTDRQQRAAARTARGDRPTARSRAQDSGADKCTSGQPGLISRGCWLVTASDESSRRRNDDYPSKPHAAFDEAHGRSPTKWTRNGPETDGQRDWLTVPQPVTLMVGSRTDGVACLVTGDGTHPIPLTLSRGRRPHREKHDEREQHSGP